MWFFGENDGFIDIVVFFEGFGLSRFSVFRSY